MPADGRWDLIWRLKGQSETINCRFILHYLQYLSRTYVC